MQTLPITIASCLLIVLACFSCDQQPDNIQQTSEGLKLLPEEFQTSLAISLQNRDIAIANNNLDSAIYWYQQTAEAYAGLEQWDSLKATVTDAFYYVYYADNLPALLPALDTCIAFAHLAPDTIQAKISEIQGFILRREGKVEEALNSYKSASEAWEKQPPSKTLASCYNMLGILYNMLEDYPLSEIYYRNGVSLNKELGDTTETANCLYNLGKVLLSQGRWEEAVGYFEQSQQLGNYDDGSVDAKLAQAYIVGGQFDLALPFAENVLELVAEEDNDDKYNAYTDLAHIYLNLGETERAIYFSQQALELALEEFSKGHREIAKSHLLLGSAYQQNGMQNLSLQAFQQAIIAFLANYDPVALEDCPTPQDHFSRESYLVDAIRYKGQIFEQKFEQNGDLATLEAADKHYDAAVQYINQIKALHTETGSKAFYSKEYSIPFCSEAIQAKLKLYTITQNNQYLQDAYYLARQSTAFLLREAVNDDRAMAIAQVPADTIDLLRSLDAQIGEMAEAIPETPAERDSLINLNLELKRQRINLLDQIAINYPEYYHLKHDLQPAPLETLQSQLDSGTLVVNYFMGEDQLYTFAFDQNELKVFTLPIDSSFFENVHQFRQTLADLDFVQNNSLEAEAQFLRTSAYLYSNLLDTVLLSFQDDGHDQLLMVPDGILNYVAFECLLNEPADTWLQTDAFLIDDYSFRYAYYADLLLADDQNTTASRFLGFGTEYDDQTLNSLNIEQQDSIKNPSLENAVRGKNLSKLIYADDEVIDIADMVAGRTFTNQQATKENFLSHNKDYDVIHIAAHSFIDDQNDSTAYIAFHQANQEENFLLSIPEIYGLDLEADMVALSSCQTGIGAIQRGEGVMSLARAFNFAGSKSILASQWSISDQSSFFIMKSFYSYLKEGMPKDKALQKAKMDYLSNDQTSSPAYRIPAYWAAIVLVGNKEVIVFESAAPLPYWYWIIGGVLGLLLIGWIFKKRNL